jgi:hypothetical protein
MAEFESETSVLLDVTRILIIVAALPVYLLLICLVAITTLPLYLFTPLINKLLRYRKRYSQAVVDTQNK